MKSDNHQDITSIYLSYQINVYERNIKLRRMPRDIVPSFVTQLFLSLLYSAYFVNNGWPMGEEALKHAYPSHKISCDEIQPCVFGPRRTCNTKLVSGK